MNTTLKKAGRAVSYTLGTVIPNITFSIIFITFSITIVSRYALKMPVAWAYEVSILAYMWTMFFGVGKALSRDEHVVFALVYDVMSPKMRSIFRVATNVIIITLLLIVFIPSINSLLAKKMITGVLKMKYTVVFAPLIYMFGEVIVRSIMDLIKQLKTLKAGKDPDEGAHHL